MINPYLPRAQAPSQPSPFLSQKMSSTAALGGPGGACKVCGGVNFEIEDHGSKVCRDCGHVLEDSCIVSEVQFEENARGGANVIGQYVGDTNRFHIEGI